MNANSTTASMRSQTKDPMTARDRLARGLGRVASVAALVGVLVASAGAQDPQPVLVVMDRDSIAHTRAPNAFTTRDVNEELAAVGMRDPLPYFRRNIGQNVTLTTSEADNRGWYALVGVPATWDSAPGENDGFSNYFLAGPGLGSPEESGERVRLLREAGLAGLDATGVEALLGRTVCGIVYQGDLVPAATAADLSGATLGIVAFRVAAVTASADASPNVEVSVLDPGEACQGEFVLPLS